MIQHSRALKLFLFFNRLKSEIFKNRWAKKWAKQVGFFQKTENSWDVPTSCPRAVLFCPRVAHEQIFLQVGVSKKTGGRGHPTPTIPPWVILYIEPSLSHPFVGKNTLIILEKKFFVAKNIPSSQGLIKNIGSSTTKEIAPPNFQDYESISSGTLSCNFVHLRPKIPTKE